MPEAGQGKAINEQRAALLRAVGDAVVRADGELAPELRAAIVARAGRLAGRPVAAGAELPASLAACADKVATRAYAVTDDDIEALRTAGYGDDAILETILSTAAGAGLARLTIGLAALGRKG